MLRPATLRPAVALLSALLFALVASASQGDGKADPKAAKVAAMEKYRDKYRPLLIFAPDARDLRYVEQKARIEAHADALKERAMALLELLKGGESLARGEKLADDEARALRSKYEIKDADFRVILVGKDGGEKVRWFEPVNADVLFEEVDKMPMRQQEIKKKTQGDR